MSRVALCILFAAAVTSADVEKLVQDGKLDQAIDVGRKEIGARPDDVDLRMALARALAAKARRFNHVVNVKLTEEALAKGEIKVPNANLGDAPLQVGYDAGLFEEAILHLDAGIAKAPKREDVRVLECFLLTDAGRIDRARAAIEEALTFLPKTQANAKTFGAYGPERAKRGDVAGGAALLAPVASAFSDDAAVQADYGNLLTRLGRKADAYAALDRAVGAAPKDVRTARTRALSAMLLRDFPRARSAFDATFRLGRAPSDQFAAATAAYGVDPKGSVELMRALAAPSAGTDPAMSDLANLYALAGTAGPGSEAAMGLARKLVASDQLVIAIPLLDRAVQAKNAAAKPLLAKVLTDLGMKE